jgi:hypothetical protein
MDLWPLTYHPEMRLQDFIKGAEAPKLTEILFHFYKQHHRNIPTQKTYLEKMLNGLFEHSKLRGKINQSVTRVIFQLGDSFDFSVEPERRWKEFEEELYDLHCKGGRCF